MLPSTPAEYQQYITIWLGFIKSPQRIRDRFESEKNTLWTTLKPQLTDAEKSELETLVKHSGAAADWRSMCHDGSELA